MKVSAIISIILFFFLPGQAQKVQTIVPEQIVAGNAFQVQYIISDPSALIDITTPQLENLRLISGPNHYKGNSLVNGKMQAIENISFTVMALKEGLVRIKGVMVDFRSSQDETTEDVVLNVLPPPKGSFNAVSSYTDSRVYAPASGADLDKLVEENLFIKAEVNRRICFLGEAITATFKLYSRLQSTSEVLNAPSLYGFSIMDIFNVNEVHQGIENINGKIFNTSILRKLQLYPTHTGKLVVDAMQLQNEIDFEDSVTGKKIKVEKLLASNPIEISVKPFPGKQPADFSGAVGKFEIHTDFQNEKIVAGQQGKLIIRISGKGNFIQFAAPTIEWPDGFDVFDPLVSEDLNRELVPVEGVREYVFTFTTGKTGTQRIPSIEFSFFDPASGSFKTVRSQPLKVEVVPAIQQQKNVSTQTKEGKSKRWLWILSGVILLAGMTMFLLKKKEPTSNEEVAVTPSYDQKLQHLVSAHLNEKDFCFELQKLINTVGKASTLTREQKSELQSINSDCQLMIYSDVIVEGRKEILQKRAADFLRQLS